MANKDIHTDNEVYFLGSKEKGDNKPKPHKKWMVLLLIIFVVILIGILIFALRKEKAEDDYYFEPESTETDVIKPNESIKNDTIKGYTEILEETVNDVPLYVYRVHDANLSLSVGTPDKTDPHILFVTQAADIRGDNYDIVGDFVLAGKQLARGVAKTGFCAVINNNITIGIAEQTPLLQAAIDSAGYFFRQYPLVDNGILKENKPKNKSIRRALATRNGKVIIVESRSPESFHDFSQALIDIGVTDAIYLVGGSIAFGWYYDKEHKKTEAGIEPSDEKLKNTSYIVWKSKQ